MTRSRRRTLALTVSFAVHLLAFAVLTPVVVPHIRTRLASYEPLTIQVQLIRLRNGLGRTTTPAPAQLSALAPSAPGTPQPPPPVAPPEDEDESAEPSVVARNSPLDIEPLFRVPFRNAVGQAEAALRAGLDCAHVDLQALPPSLLDRCAAAAQRRGGGVPPDGSKLLS